MPLPGRFTPMSMQDTASGVALWRQVADGIERGIADGTLCRRRKAAGRDRNRRHLSRQPPHRAPGAGDAGRARPGARRTRQRHLCRGAAARLSACARARGSPKSSAPAAASRAAADRAKDEPATRELARQLGLKTGAPLIRIEALRFADRTPICVSTNWLAAERFADAGGIYERVRSMTKLLAHYGIRDYRRASTRVTAAIVDATDAARLDLALGRPMLVVDSTDVDADGKPLLTSRSRFAAERVEFVVENSAELRITRSARRPMIAKRSLPEIQSMAATATRIIRIRNATYRNHRSGSARRAAGRCRPRRRCR